MARLPDPQLADRRRRQIMDAAIACFRRRGFHQATMAEICAEAEISAGALYRYFRSKTEIIGAIAEDKRSEADEAFVRNAEREGLIEALAGSARDFFVKFAQGDGSLIAEIIAEAIRDETVAAPLRVTDSRRLALLTKAIAAAKARGEVDPRLEPETTAHVMMAAFEGMGLRRAFLGDADVETAVDQFRTLAERYLKPQHE